MSKTKKSKLLASMLCATVVAGLYAGPVMAGSVDSITGDSSGIHINIGYEMDGSTSVTGGVINGSDGLYTTGALGNSSGSLDHKIVGRLTISSEAIINSLESKSFNQLTIGGTTFNTTNIEAFKTDYEKLKETVATLAPGEDLTPRVEALEKNTNGITRTGNTTMVDGNIRATGNIIANQRIGVVSGSRYGMIAEKNTLALGDFKINDSAEDIKANAKFYVDGSTGNVMTKGDVTTEAGYGLNTIGENTSGINRDSNTTSIEENFRVHSTEGYNAGTVDIYGSMIQSNDVDGGKGVLNGDTLTLAGTEYGNVTTITGGTINTNTVYASKDVVANGTSLVTVGEKTTALEEKTQAISYENGKTTVGGVTFNNGFVDASVVKAHSVFFDGGTLSAGGISAVQGKFVVDENGSVKSFGDVQSANYSLENLGENFDKLQTGVGETNKNVAGIKREGETTIIEGATSFDANGMKTSNIEAASGTIGGVVMSDGGIITDRNALSVVGGVSMSGGRLQAEQGTIGGVAIKDGHVDGVDVSQLRDTVAGNVVDIGELQEKTTDIKYTDGVTEIGKGVLAVNNEGYVTINNGMLTVDAESGYVTMGNKIEFDTASGNITANNVYSKNYNLETIGDQLNELETGVGTDISDLKRKTTDIEYADGVTTIAGANKFTENGMQVGTTVINKDGSIGAGNGNFTVTADGEVIVRGENGATSITGDAITIGDTVITNGVITTEKAVIGGVDISNGRVDGVDVSELAGSVFDGSKDIAELKRITTGMDYQNGVTSFSGDITFRHNGDTVSLGGLVDKVNDIYDRTSGISKDENGNTVIDGGLVVDGDTTGGSITGNGDMNISGDGQIGGDLDVAGSVNAGNVNTDNINAGKGTIGGIHMENGEMTVGDTTVNGDGVNVGGENGTSITDKDVVINQGTDSEVSLSDVGNRVDNLEQGMASMSNRIDKLEDRIDKVGAMSAAIANLRTMGYDPTAPTEIAVGLGQYRSETGAALGLFHYPNKDFMLSLSVSTSGDEVMGGIGATWKFGRKTPEQMLAAEKEKAAKAKLAKAEAMKKAAAEAKVAEQQAKHAKMAAEKAAK